MILAIPGSLRRQSINAAALRAAASAAARDGLLVEVDDSPRQLPHFNPDLESAPPATVARFRRSLEAADGVVLAVPEYTLGIPGALKNSLDWLVGSGSLYRKPVALLHVAPPGRGAHVRESLEHVLKAHNAAVTRHSVPIAPRDLDASGELSDGRIVRALQAVVAELAVRASVAGDRSADERSLSGC